MDRIKEQSLIKRARKRVYRVIGLKRAELEMLVSMAIYLMLKGRKTAGKDAIINFSYINPHHCSQDYKVFYLLRDNGYIEGHKVGRGTGYGLTWKGRRALELYEHHLEEVEKWMNKVGDFDNLEKGEIPVYGERTDL